MKRFICHHSCFIVSKWFIYLMSAPIFGIKLDIGSTAATELNVTFIWQMWMYALKKISNILFEFDIINHNQRQVKISTLESYKGLLSNWLGYFLFWKKKIVPAQNGPQVCYLLFHGCRSKNPEKLLSKWNN